MHLRRLAAIILVASLPMPAATLAKEPSMRQIVSFDNDPREPRSVAVNDGVMGGCSSGAPTNRTASSPSSRCPRPTSTAG